MVREDSAVSRWACGGSPGLGVTLVGFVVVDPESSVVPVSL